MNSAENNANLLNGGEITTLLERYLCVCHSEQNRDSTENEKKKTKKSKIKRQPRLPLFRFKAIENPQELCYTKSILSKFDKKRRKV